MVDEHLRLIVKVARLYYEQGLRQQAIADLLSLSQARVSRLLKEASDRGIVRSIVDVPDGIYSDLESALETSLGLQHAIVIESSGRLEKALGAATAAYLRASLTSNVVIGVSTWSSALVAMVDALVARSGRMSQSVDRVIQMFGGVGSPDVQVQATRLTSELASRFGGEAVFMPAPAVVGTSTIAGALRDDPDVHKVMRQWDSINVSLVGIGRLEPSPLLARSGNAITDEEMSELRDRGAVGDVCLRYFDASGTPIASTFDERVIGMTSDAIRSVPRRIGVAGGAAKVQAIRAACLGGWVNVLVTDLATAELLITS